MVKIVATTSLPVDRLTATDCNAAARANLQLILHVDPIEIHKNKDILPYNFV